MEQANKYYEELNHIRLQLFNVQAIGESGLQQACLRFFGICNSVDSNEQCRLFLSAIEGRTNSINERLSKASALPSVQLKNESLQHICTDLRMAVDAFIYVLKPMIETNCMHSPR